jgi:hypothetical protein
MMITSQKATQKSITRPRLSVHHTSFLWASFACQELVLSTTQRLVAPSGAEALHSERSRRSECALVAAGGYSRSRSRDPQMDAGALWGNSPSVCATASRVSLNSGESWRFAGALTVLKGGCLSRPPPWNV